MLRLAGLLYGMVATTLAGVAVTGALVLGVSHWTQLLDAAVTAAIMALPVTYFLASRLLR